MGEEILSASSNVVVIQTSTSAAGSFVSSIADHKPVQQSAEAHHLSLKYEASIRLLPGNDRCVDCKAIYPQWSSVSFGVLLCLACAGRHRSFGVNVSFVKSLNMDTWTPNERRALEAGGNAKWIAVCAGASISHLTIADMYMSGIAKAYKSRIQAAACSGPEDPIEVTASSFLSMLLDSTASCSLNAVELPVDLQTLKETQKRPSGTPFCRVSALNPVQDAPGLSVKCTMCSSAIELDQLDAHSKRCSVSSSNAVEWRRYERTLGLPNEPLGFSLSKTKGGFAEVSKVQPGGLAERSNVIVGSFVVGINDIKSSKYDEIVQLIKTLPRPLRFYFVFRPSISQSRPVSSISSVPEPVTIERIVTFEAPDTGCTFETRALSCVVSHVTPEGEAFKCGVLVGSRVVEVNGRRFLNGCDALSAIHQSARPLRLKIIRVEGLMRGWNDTI